MIKNIIFDFDGTLVDTKQQILFCFQESMKRLNLPKCTPEACASTIGLPLKEAFIKLVQTDDELANLCVQTYEVCSEKPETIFLPPYFHKLAKPYMHFTRKTS